jgi:CHAT domain-containing protein
VRCWLGVVRSLLIVPIENLGVVPFAALPVTPANDPLINFTTITVAPGFSVVHEDASQSPHRTWKRALIVGNPDLTSDPKWIFPDLPGARREAIDVGTLFGTTPLLGAAATHGAVATALAKPGTLDLIYFATHAISDPDNPQDNSFVALRGGNLYTRQVEKLKLKGRPLVVLSACQTGLGKEVEGGIFGMAVTWHFAGADEVVTSLWNVDDAATHDLMLSFMKQVKDDVPPSRALARAMLQQRTIEPDSMDWASFTVYGGLPH